MSAGCAALAAEERKHVANDAKRHEPSWICVPLVTESYDAWGSEAVLRSLLPVGLKTCHLIMQAQVLGT